MAAPGECWAWTRSTGYKGSLVLLGGHRVTICSGLSWPPCGLSLLGTADCPLPPSAGPFLRTLHCKGPEKGPQGGEELRRGSILSFTHLFIQYMYSVPLLCILPSRWLRREFNMLCNSVAFKTWTLTYGSFYPLVGKTVHAQKS